MVCGKYWVQEKDKWTERQITEQIQGKISKCRKEICNNNKKNYKWMKACSRKELKKSVFPEEVKKIHAVAWAT